MGLGYKQLNASLIMHADSLNIQREVSRGFERQPPRQKGDHLVL